MKKILFLCDIDNTLMYSYKHKAEGDVCIELLKDKEQGFTSPKTLLLLEQLKRCDNIITVPLTTRSIEQYTRIDFGVGTPDMALCTNGTILLDKGRSDTDWFNDSLDTVNPMKSEMERLFGILSPGKDFIRVRMVDDMYLFVYCAEGVSPHETAAKLQEMTPLNVQYAGKKIYLFPPAADKGFAARRMAERIKPDLIVAAGDSEIDLPMLKYADVAIIPNNQKMTAENYKKVMVADRRFSEFVPETVMELSGCLL